MARATVSQIKEYFQSNGGGKVQLKDLQALKDTPGISYATAYDDFAEGIGDATYTY